jgi:hypothetical protein
VYDFTSSYRGIEIVPRLQRGCYRSAQNSLIRAFHGITNCGLRPAGEEHERETQLLTNALHEMATSFELSVDGFPTIKCCCLPKLGNAGAKCFQGSQG